MQAKFTDALKSLNRTCRDKFLALYGGAQLSSEAANNMPESWIEEEENEEVRQKLRNIVSMRAGYNRDSHSCEMPRKS